MPPSVGEEVQHTSPSRKQQLNDSHMSAYKDFTKHNDVYVANFGDKGNLPLPPGKKLLIGMSFVPVSICSLECLHAPREQSPAWTHASSKALSFL